MTCRRALLSFWLAAAVAVPWPAAAQATRDDHTIAQSIKIYDAVVRFPAPSWYEGRDFGSIGESHHEQAGPEFVMEFIPKSERFDSWSRMYTLRGTYLAARQPVPLADFVSLGIAPFLKVCGRENLTVQDLMQDAVSRTIVIYCQNSPNGPANIGYGDGVGLIGVARFFKVKDTLLKISQEWRGKAFQTRDQSTWPVSRSELVTMIDRFATISASADPP